MAIGYARVEFVKRSVGKNACSKAAYNSRSEIEFKGTEHAKRKDYDWSGKSAPAHHDVLLPNGVDLKFKDPEYLWNVVEEKEVRSNAQVAIELVLALPDDKVVPISDKIELARTFVQKHFVENRLAVQLDVHAPEPLLIVTRDNQELGLKKGNKGDVISKTDDRITFELESGGMISFNPKEFTGYIEKEHNWHAHVLVTTRKFKVNGLEFQDHKARDLMPRINKGKVISGPDWGKLWALHQNQYFQEKGIELRVDENGIVPQEHLGPFRMRGRAFSLFEEHHQRLESNQLNSKDPAKILTALTAQKSVFVKEDVDYYLQKYVSAHEVDEVSKAFWQQPSLVQLVDKQTGELLSKFSSQEVIDEEEQILRIADRIYAKDSAVVNPQYDEKTSVKLNQEQQKAFRNIAQGQNLSLIQGYAGTGKSYLLKALQASYEEAGYRVRALGPDNATSDVLIEKGFSHSENVYRFLFGLQNGRRQILKGKEVWILDESGKLGNRPLLEFLKEAEKKNVKVILSGDVAQLPPVERGGMFRVFCQQYGSDVLEDIQRQKDDKQRDITRSLAQGEFSSAIDKLCSVHGLRWSSSKREAMEELITRWARDTRELPQSTTLVLASTNKEVRVLNEMVRVIKRQREELGEKEFKCSTSKGDVYVSVGDRILFLGNNKEFGLTNGLSGTLIEAEQNRFVVSIKTAENKKQIVAFDPQQYHAFQLGYASTFFRAQGHTLDRAYVLHSHLMNKEAFYVGLTRHVRDVQYFVSKNEVYCLADLKRQVLKSSSKALTVEYTTLESLNAQASSDERTKQIQNLKESGSFIDRLKSYGLETFNMVQDIATVVKERIQDRLPNQEFYNPPKPPTQDELYSVSEVKLEEFLNPKEPSRTPPPLPKGLLNDVKEEPAASHLFDKLPIQHETLAADYLDKVEKASSLKLIVDAEKESSASGDVQFAAHFHVWQEACGQRNQSAYELVHNIPKEELQKALSAKSLAILQEQAHRYESFLDRNDQTKPQLEEQLKDNLEKLLYHLFPEGPQRCDRNSFRFGSKGSLSVVHAGPKAGRFYDFEQGEGGSLLKLIQREAGLGGAEAKKWARDFLGVVSDLSIPQVYAKSNFMEKSEDFWVSLKPDPKIPAPSLAKISSGKKLAFYYDEVMRHPYKDENGQLLYYVLRLKDKNDPSKKITPPLSYGYWKSSPEKVGWELKGFQEEKRSLYNLHLLKEKLHATILVVEGEKTADFAPKGQGKDEYISVTWPSGSAAVHKADWSPLQGRRVLIWPDNDRAGYEAGERVCCELRKIGAESIQMVNKDDLKRFFPEKWDLADPLPDAAPNNLISKLIASASQNGINLEQALLKLNVNNDPVNKARINEILWRVDERLRPGLEKKNGVQFWKTNEEILKETSRILSDQEKRKGELKEKFGADVTIGKLTYQISVQEAAKGRKLRTAEVDLVKRVIQEHGHLHVPKDVGKGASELAVDKLLIAACDKAINSAEFKDVSRIKTKAEISSSLEQAQKQLEQPQLESAQKKEHGKQNDIGINI